jgi:hypothetical protein
LGLFGVCTYMCHFWQSDYIRSSKARFFITGDGSCPDKIKSSNRSAWRRF